MPVGEGRWRIDVPCPYFSDPRDYTKVHFTHAGNLWRDFLRLTQRRLSMASRHLAWDQKYWAPFRAASIERVRRELPNPKIVSIPGTHTDFLFTSRQEVVTAMRRFLSE